MLQLNRVYKNSAGEEIRIDVISLRRKRNRIVKVGLMETGAADVFVRDVNKMNMHVSADRTVTSIELIGNYDTAETSSGDYLWASWTSPSARVDMSDLPAVGDSI